MGCAKYKDWLSDAALGALDPKREAELRAHVAGCEACRAALESEQALFAAMDAGLESSVASEPSPAFVARSCAASASARGLRRGGSVRSMRLAAGVGSRRSTAWG